MPGLFRFPNPVNEVAARSVAAQVVPLWVATLAFRTPWLLWPLAVGFLAKVATGPTLSLFGRLSAVGLIPESVCVACADIRLRRSPQAA